MGRRHKQTRSKPDFASGEAGAQPNVQPDQDDAPEIATLAQRHLRFGWRLLFVFVLLGLVLETLHGFKVGWYLEIANSTRRQLWTLAHSHGTLLAVLNLIFAWAIQSGPGWSRRRRSVASACLFSAALLLPAGFFLGGLMTYEGDPGIGIVLVPAGGILLLIAVLSAART